ncbi:MOSC domain-containing protein [Aurantimonas coralicida]|uniref:MOSC domain-containing protein n=1 Tax=Aurantimonas coralicida TaxID=182270 RepID=UPI001D1845F9|nr:MOSC N-terminal beta barrel domain-containing protein [Aurantimonas coralicida]MCC4299743.1 MOSC domain-containing protein [Aurantimonas coralicida]
MELGSIHIHPVKAGRSIERDENALEVWGLEGDRRWMLVDETGRFLSQREHPPLALLDAQPDVDGLILSYEEVGERFVPVPEGDDRLTVTIWGDAVDAALADDATNAALSQWLQRPVRLVHLDRTGARHIDPAWAPKSTDSAPPVAFADGFPLLIANPASLRALNGDIVRHDGDAVPMSRFRPNLVIDGAEAWAEDDWATIRIGEAVIDLVKPCARCIVTTVDQATGTIAGTQPMDALRRIRFSATPRVPGVLFGWNAVPRGPAVIRRGDPVEVVARRGGVPAVRDASGRGADR